MHSPRDEATAAFGVRIFSGWGRRPSTRHHQPKRGGPKGQVETDAAHLARWGIAIDANVRKHDVGTVTVPSEQTESPVETLTIRLEPAGPNSLSLVIEWEHTRVRTTLKQAS